MIIKDKIYGEYEIDDVITVELLKSPSVKRLKNISQYGVPDKYYHLKNYSRLEHSIGVMILLKKLGADLEEQIAGLIHDVSHLSFSHVADWVFAQGNKGNENLQNTLMEEFIRNSDIAGILIKHGFSVGRLLDEKNYSLLENKIPDLCADRIDYALREFEYWLNPKIVKQCLNGLKNYNGEIIFTDQKTAFLFATNFLELQTQHWGGFEAVIRYHLFSEALKLALKEKKITKQDFYKDESFVLEKLENTKNQKITELLCYLKNEPLPAASSGVSHKSGTSSSERSSSRSKLRGILAQNKNLKDYKYNFGRKVFKKFRYVDPKVIIDKKLVRLSNLSKDFKKLLDKHRKNNEKGVLV